MPIRDLASHPARYVTIAELAEYWAVSRQQIYKRIESGTLQAIRLGSRLYRVRTETAIEYERRAIVGDRTNKLPQVIGVQRIFRKSGTE
jgi:excisionase family DNA binding protein